MNIMTSIPTSEVSIAGTDSERARLDLVMTAILTVVDDAVIYFVTLDWTTGYHYGVSVSDVEDKVSNLSDMGIRTLHVAYGEYSPVSGESSLFARR
jgi:hypothetical protein